MLTLRRRSTRASRSLLAASAAVTLAVSLTACTGDEADEPTTPDPAATETAAAAPGSVAIDPAQDTAATLGDFTVTVPAGATTGPGTLVLSEADAAPMTDLPWLALGDGIAVAISDTELVDGAAFTIHAASQAGPDHDAPAQDTQDLAGLYWQREGGAALLGGTTTAVAGDPITGLADTAGQGWMAAIDSTYFGEEILEGVRGAYDSISATRPPTCEGEEAKSEAGDGLAWCAGVSGGRGSVTITNPREAFIQVALPGGWTSEGTGGVSLRQLIEGYGDTITPFTENFPDGREIWFVPGGATMTFAGQSGGLDGLDVRARNSRIAYFLQAFDETAKSYASAGQAVGVEHRWASDWVTGLSNGAAGAPGVAAAWGECLRTFGTQVSITPWDSPDAVDLGRIGRHVSECFPVIAVAEAGAAQDATEASTAGAGLLGEAVGRGAARLETVTTDDAEFLGQVREFGNGEETVVIGTSGAGGAS